MNIYDNLYNTLVYWSSVIVINVCISVTVNILWNENKDFIVNDYKNIIKRKIKKMEDNIHLMNEGIYQFREKCFKMHSNFANQISTYEEIMKDVIDNNEYLLEKVEDLLKENTSFTNHLSLINNICHNLDEKINIINGVKSLNDDNNMKINIADDIIKKYNNEKIAFNNDDSLYNDDYNNLLGV